MNSSDEEESLSENQKILFIVLGVIALISLGLFLIPKNFTIFPKNSTKPKAKLKQEKKSFNISKYYKPIY